MSKALKRKWKVKRAFRRSGFEDRVEAFLETTGTRFEYEPFKIRYTVPEKQRTYTPDFILETGVIIETKGYFDADDRRLHLLIKEQHPKLDIRFLFYRDNKLSKKSKMKYSDWCVKYGFIYAIGEQPPADWYTS